VAGTLFKRELIISGIGMLLLVLIWAQSEYHNAGGWPTSGFSHRSSIPNVWNYWIIYPIILWAVIMGFRGWPLYGNKPISESEIEKEMKPES
jgi:2TM domain-containing protein